MAMVYLLTQTETLGTNEQNVRYDRDVVAAYMDLDEAYRDLAMFKCDAEVFNTKLRQSNAVTVTFPGDSTVYTLIKREYSIEDCPLYGS
jgi:hypothetical protein